MTTVIDLGCGRYKVPGAIGVDCVSRDNVDIVHDLNTFPFPFEDSSVDEIHCYHFLEHVADFISTVKELYRIGKNGCRICVKAPHASCVGSAYADPTHKKVFTKNSFLHFSAENAHIYGLETNIVLEKVELHYFLYQGIRNNEKLTKMPLFIGKIIDCVANINGFSQNFFERFLLGYIGGFEEVYYELRIIK